MKLDWATPITIARNDSISLDRSFSEYNLGALSAPVASGQLVVVSALDSHQVVALDTRSGEKMWSFKTGGKVDSPPTIAGELVIFGCGDGHVYALDAGDGQLVWRFQAAATDAISRQHGHIASAFPLPGSLLVLGEKVIAVAGHHTDLGGLHCWVLDRKSGKPLAQRVIRNDQPEVVSNGVLVADEDNAGFWIGKQLHLSTDLKDLPSDWYAGPKPAIAFDRGGTRMRFRTNEGRGGSTHGWKGAMAIPGRNRLLRGHRLAVGNDIVFGMIDPNIRSQKAAVLWAIPSADEQGRAVWALRNEDLGGHESYGALAVAGDRLYLGGGSRNGNQGVLHIISAKNGKLLATHKLPARATECGIAIAGGRLFVSCEDGTLVCFASAPEK